MNNYHKIFKIKKIIKEKIFWTAVFFSIFILLVDILTDSFLFKETFFSKLLDLYLHELFSRLLVVFSVIAFGIFSQIVFNKLKITKENLAKSEEHYRTLSENAQDIIFIISRDDLVKYINNFGTKIAGKPANEITGKPRSNFFPPKIAESQKKSLQKVFKTSKPISIESKTIINGKEFWLSTNLAPIINQKGKVTSIVGISHNITKRKKIEEELNIKSTLLDKTTDAVFVVGLDGKLLFVNESAYKNRGYTKEELLNIPLQKLNAPEFADKLKGRFKKMLKTQKPLVFESAHYKKDGTIMPVEVNSRLINYKGEKAFLGFIRDITERKKIENALKNSEKKLRDISSVLGEGVYVLDKNYKITFLNPTAEKLLGWNEKELLGKKAHNIIHYQKEDGSNYPISDCPVLNVFKTAKSYRTDNDMFIRKDGSSFPVSYIASPIIENGDVKAIVSVFQDTTKRKKELQDLKKAYDIEHHIAKTLQKSLQPAFIPKIKDLEVKFFYQSATEKAEVGGDFYDIFEIPNIGYGLVMGDVAGKGIGAAAETARVKYLLRDKAYNKKHPEKVLSSVNQALIKQRTFPFVALTYTIYDPASSEIILSNASNPYPYIVKTDTFIKITGIPLSIKTTETYPRKVIKLEKNDTVIMYTDGLIDARNNGSLFGEEGVRSYMLKNRSLSLNQLIKGLVKEARSFSNDNLLDDILVIGLKKK